MDGLDAMGCWSREIFLPQKSHSPDILQNKEDNTGERTGVFSNQTEFVSPGQSDPCILGKGC